jgi:hypothetical protein
MYIRSNLDVSWDIASSIIPIANTAFKWNHVVITKSNGIMKVYIDGSLELERALNVDFSYGQEYFYLGDSHADDDNGFFYDELIFLKKALDDNTIKSWYEMDKPFVDLHPKTNTKRPSNVSITEV